MIVESFVFAYYFVLVYRLVLHYRPDASLRVSHLLSRSTGMVLLVFLLGVILLPEKFYRLTHGGEEARLGGYLMNPNELGMLSVVGAGMCCLELLKGTKKGGRSFFPVSGDHGACPNGFAFLTDRIHLGIAVFREQEQ